MQPNNAPPAPTAQQPTQAEIQAHIAKTTCQEVQNFAIHMKIKAASVTWSDDARQFCFDQFVELARLFAPPK